MSAASAPKAPGASRRGTLIAVGAAILVLVAIAFDTKVVQVGSEQDTRQQAFQPDRFGEEQFPRIQAFVIERAVDAARLGPEVLADKAKATEAYGTPSSTGAILPVKFSGTVGEGKSGVYEVSVPGVPADIRVRVQTGPAINGTELRDVTGDIAFGNFKNQIEFQDAGSGINRAMKKVVLDTIDTTALSGKTIEVVGAFRLINPKNWLVTPVQVAVP